jgi:hypothetical protein
MYIRKGYREIADFFAYVIGHAPDFPTEPGMTIECAFQMLNDGVDAQQTKAKKPAALHACAMCREELRKALAMYRSGDGDAVVHLQYADQWFAKAR